MIPIYRSLHRIYGESGDSHANPSLVFDKFVDRWNDSWERDSTKTKSS